MMSFIYVKEKFKLIFLDFVILSVMPVLVVLLRFEGALPEYEAAVLHVWLLSSSVLGVGIFYLFGMYHRIWHYARIWDLNVIVGAVTLSSTGTFLLLFLVGEDVPKSVFFDFMDARFGWYRFESSGV